ncbi:RNase H domain-containing protein [Trichonephila clavipes]|nr:RNase H domain-containing protein [Trichonephila clavipes]
MRKHGFIDFNVDTSTPIDSFNHVEFREELLTSTPKNRSHLELLRQLALEVINDISDQALIIYTDGSRSNTGRAGSGIFSNTPGNVKISIREILTTVPSLDRNSLLLVVLSIMLSTPIRTAFVQGVKPFFTCPCSSSGLLGHFPVTVV